jgi:hypothetical protein
MAKEYQIARTAGRCCRCDKVLDQREEFQAVLIEQGEQFVRQDWCLACWESPQRGEVAGLFGQWRSRMPEKQARKKLFVDDGMLLNFFLRLGGQAEAARVNFRFVLALVLLRKKLLSYEGTRKSPDGGEVWAMRIKGEEQVQEVVNPRLDEQRITEVSQQLGEILQGEL